MEKNRALIIKAFGGFSITAGDYELDGFKRTRVQELLVYLLLNRGQSIGRSQIASLFWPETSQKQAFSNLRNLLYCLRQDFQDHDQFIAADNQNITWIEDSLFWFDVAEFNFNLAKAAITEADRKRLDYLEAAVNLYGGDLLPGNYSKWLLVEREQLAQALNAALGELITLYESRCQYQPAIQHAQVLMQRDPLHEPTCAQLMRLQALNKDRTAAFETYQLYVKLLQDELGLPPSRSLRDFHEQLLQYDSFPRSKTTSNRLETLVGREKSWKTLQKAWQKAYQEPQLVVISGEVGIGKTHLAEAFIDAMAHQGVSILHARCYATEARFAYAPIITWLQNSHLENLDSSTLSELSRFVPSISKKYPHIPRPGPIVEDWQRLHLFKAIQFALINPHDSLILFLDDFHSCDVETLNWLYYLFSSHHECFAQPQLLVITTINSLNPDLVVKIPSWKSKLTQKNRLTTLQLSRLNATDTITLANRISDHALDPNLEKELFQITEGHPFFIVEWVSAAIPIPLRHLKPSTALPTSIPNKVRRMLESHLSHLSPLAQKVVEQAAVIGRVFNYPALTQLTNLSEDALVDCLDECWRSQVIREHPQNTYGFSHNKLHEVAYEGISLTRRRWLHKQVAKILESLHAEELGRFAGVIAGHYEKAGFIEQAISYYDLAAQTASQVYAHEKALVALLKAISLLEQNPHKGIYQNYFSEFQERIGDINALNAHFNAACKAYQTALNQTPETKTLTLVRLMLKMGCVYKNMRADYQVIADQYQRAANILSQPTLDRDQTWWEAWCDLQLEQMDFHYCWHKADILKNQIQNVRAEIETYGTQVQKAALYKHLMFNIVLNNRFIATTEAVQYAHNALKALPKSAGPDLITSYQFSLGFSQLWHGDYDKAITNLQEAYRLSEYCGDIMNQARCSAYLILAHRLTDQHIEVKKSIQTCLSIAERAKMTNYIGVSQAGFAWLSLRCPDQKTHANTSLSETRYLAQQAMAFWQKSVTPYPFQWQAMWLLLYVAMSRSQLVEAMHLARQLYGPNQQALNPEIEESLTSALASWRRGSRDKARELLNQALTTAQQMNFI